MRAIALPAVLLFFCSVPSVNAAEGQWLKDPQGGCAVFNAIADSSDGVRWSGDCVDGLASGLGTATFTKGDATIETFNANFAKGVVQDGHVVVHWGEGWSYDGEEVNGRFDGEGVLVNDKKDRFEGTWSDGKLNGSGVVTRANGERYAGNWKDGVPNGKGELERVDGSVITGVFVEDNLAQEELTQTPADENASLPSRQKGENGVQIPVQAKADAQPNARPFKDIGGETLFAVDGSSATVETAEGSIELCTTTAGGTQRKSVFVFLNDKLGTVIEDTSAGGAATGVFRVVDQGLEIEYADGRTAILASNEDGGLHMKLQSMDRSTSCLSWYAKGHTFSIVEKKAALAQYANQLGLPADKNRGLGCAAEPSVATVSLVEKNHALSDAKTGNDPFAFSAPAGTLGSLSSLSPVPVKNSEIYLIDNPGPSVPASGAGADAAASLSSSPDIAGASHCLSIESDGVHWGFRNNCANSVQFSYCLMHGAVPLTACESGSVPGSVAANGFGVLSADHSLGELNADNDFRWIACNGGAGEVVAHLDHADPPSGRCERAVIQTAAGTP